MTNEQLAVLLDSIADNIEGEIRAIDSDLGETVTRSSSGDVTVLNGLCLVAHNLRRHANTMMNSSRRRTDVRLRRSTASP